MVRARAAVAAGILVCLGLSYPACNPDIIIDQAGVRATSIYDKQITTSPSVLDFGHVEVGVTKLLTLTIANIGATPLTIYDIAVDRESSFRLDPVSDYVIGVEDELVLDVRYAPSKYEAAAANLVISSDDPVLPETTVGLAGRCDPPEIALSPSIYDFGVAYLGCTLEQPLYLQNVGDGLLYVYNIDFESSSSDMTLDLSDISFPLDIEPGGVKILGAKFRPLVEGDVSSRIRVVSNDPEQETVSGSMTGLGEEAGLVTDITHVSANGKVDILFVVDNSGSMGDNQTTLARNFENFYRIIEDLELNWQIGVVTTDDGVLQGTTRIITPETADIQETFSENALVGAGGSGYERGLEFGYRALSEPIISGQNKGFLRQDAGLRIVFMSDEPDQSGSSVDFYVSFFQNLKLNPAMVQLNAITGGNNGCDTSCGMAYPDTRYSEAVEATGGVWASICECDFIDVLEILAEEAQVFQTTFPLSQDPVLETIEVLVNDEGSDDWHYEARYNSVIFNSEDVTPTNGAVVTITYELELDCED